MSAVRPIGLVDEAVLRSLPPGARRRYLLDKVHARRAHFFPASQSISVAQGVAPASTPLIVRPKVARPVRIYTMDAGPPLPQHVGVDSLLTATAVQTGFDRRDLVGKSRRGAVSSARHVMFYVGCKLGLSLAHLGRRFGRDHTTVLHSRNVVRGLIGAGDARTIALVAAIRRQIEAEDACARRVRVAAGDPLRVAA